MASFKVFFAVVSLTSVFLFSGVIFGWTAFNDILIRQGYYDQECRKAGKSAPCDEQIAVLNTAFTIASTAVAMVALPAGWFVDKCGPTLASFVAGVLSILGLVGIALSGEIYRSFHCDAFLISLVVLAVGGALCMFCGYQVPFLFPERSTLILELNSCLFDASTIIFPIFKILYDAGFSFSALFWIYTGIAAVVFAALIVLWRLHAAELKAVRQAAGVEDAVGSGTGALLTSKPLGQQVCTIEFVAIMVYSLVQVPRSNLYMGSVDLVNKQIAEHSGQVDSMTSVSTIIGLVIPFGFLSVPLIELCIHRCGLVGTLHITTAIGVLYNAMQLIPELYTQIGTVAVFAVWRAFLFSIISAFNAGYFGPKTMGRVMGICFLFSGLANLLQSPVIAVSLHRLDGDFRPMLLGALAVVLPLPSLVQAVAIKRRRADGARGPLIAPCQEEEGPALARSRSLTHGTASGAPDQITTALAVGRARLWRAATDGNETSRPAGEAVQA